MTRARKTLTSVVTAVLLLVGLVAYAPQAAAKTCSAFPATDHCYGAAEWPVTAPSGFLGIDAKIRTNCMTMDSADYSTNIATNEEWLNTSATTWVEAGVIIGDTQAGVLTTPHLFWAEMVGGVLTEHVGGVYPLNTYQDFRITKPAGSSIVTVTRNGVQSGQSAGHPTNPSTYISAGTETSTNSVHSFGSVSAMTYQNLTGGWVTGWTGAYFATDTPPWTTNWSTPQQWMTSLAGATC